MTDQDELPKNAASVARFRGGCRPECAIATSGDQSRSDLD